MDEIKLSKKTVDKILEKYLDKILTDTGQIDCADAFNLLSEILNPLVDTDWIYLKDKAPQDEEMIWGSTGDRTWVFKWSKEYNHFLEYTDLRGGRWEFTTTSSKVIRWQPLPLT